MRFRNILLTVSVMMLLLQGMAGTAAAWNRAGTFTLSPNFGVILFDSDLDIEDEITYGLGLGYNFTDRFGVEAALNYVDTDFDNLPGDIEGYFYRLDALYHFLPDQQLVPFVAAGLGAVTFDPDGGGSETEFAGNYGVGLKCFLSENVAFRIDLRHVMTFPENHLLYTAGLAFHFGGEAAAAPAERTAAAAPADSDGDGVTDDRDRCPGTPKGAAVNAQGCPLDSDNDGVFDFEDKCPDTPAGLEVDSMGCSVDSDGDGVPDAADRCPDTADGIEVDEKGCPLDSDNDGVIDARDRCPGTPKGATVNEQGCWIIENLRFDSNQSEIKSEFHDELAGVVNVLKQNPDLNVEIKGYTDSQGPEGYNQKLSEKRARSVMEYLIENGIDKSRLTYGGYGESNPVATNETAEGRAKNRRVEIEPN